MTRIRLLPLVLVAVSALLGIKLLGLATGTGSFAVGPDRAVASGAAEHGGEGEAAPAAADDSAVKQLMAPVDLQSEYKQLEAQKAPDHGGEAAHGEAAPKAADAAHGEAAAPADAGAAHGDAGAQGNPSGDAPAEGAPAAKSDAGHGGEGAPAEGGGHGGKPDAAKGYEDRPQEYAPPIGSSEKALLDGLAARRSELDKREQEINLRLKLLEAAEQRVNARVDDLKSIENQLGKVDPTGGGTDPNKESSQIAALVALYQTMRPKAAAAVFETLDSSVLLAIATHMEPRKLSPILAAMPPDKAGALTAAMADIQQAKRIVVSTEVAPIPAVPTGAGAVDLNSLPQIMPAPAK